MNCQIFEHVRVEYVIFRRITSNWCQEIWPSSQDSVKKQFLVQIFIYRFKNVIQTWLWQEYRRAWGLHFIGNIKDTHFVCWRWLKRNYPFSCLRSNIFNCYLYMCMLQPSVTILRFAKSFESFYHLRFTILGLQNTIWDLQNTIWGLQNPSNHSLFWPYTITIPYWSDFVPNSTFYRILIGFHRTFVTDVACRQGTLTLPDTWSRPYGTFICSTCWDQFCYFSRLCSSNIPRYFLDFVF